MRVRSLRAALVCAVDRESASVSTTAYTQQSSQAKGCLATTRVMKLFTRDTTQMHHKQSKARSQTAVWMFMWEGRVESPRGLTGLLCSYLSLCWEV